MLFGDTICLCNWFNKQIPFCREQDAEETKFKQLQRQVKRERKGAMRELKRDAAFLEHVKADKTAEKERTR